MSNDYIQCKCGFKIILELKTKDFKYKSITSLVLIPYIPKQ